MIHFDEKYFQKITLDSDQLKQYFGAAKRDLHIAKTDIIPEVIFKFSYDALIKLGIALIARQGYKVRSIPGHHIKIIETMGEILENEYVAVVGNKMRQDRNHDFYDGGALVGEKEIMEYLRFIEGLFGEI
jgi:hypothetical protein